MNRDQLIRETAKRSGYTISATKDIVIALFDVISEACKNGVSVSVMGFGTFSQKVYKPHKAYNVATNEMVTTKRSKSLGFKPSSTLKKNFSE